MQCSDAPSEVVEGINPPPPRTASVAIVKVRRNCQAVVSFREKLDLQKR